MIITVESENSVLVDGVPYGKPMDAICNNPHLASGIQVALVGFVQRLREPVVTPEVEKDPDAPHRVLKDTIMLRIEAAGMLEGFMAVVGSLSPVQRFKWDQSSWFMSDNPLLIGGINALGLDPVTVMVDDPLAP